MKLKLYIAYNVILNNKNFHLTISFMDARDTSKLHLDTLPNIYCEFSNVEYWKEPDLTVLKIHT